MRETKTILIFLLSGLGAGCVAGCLLSNRRLTNFWFRKSGKFLMPSVRYYAAFSIILLAGLAFGYVASRSRRWITGPLTSSATRYTACALTIGLSAPAVFAIFALDRDFFGSPAWFFAGVIMFLCLISVACWILTSRLYYPGLLINLLTLPSAITVRFLLAKILNTSGNQSEMVTYAIYDSLISAASGYWIVQNNPEPAETGS